MNCSSCIRIAHPALIRLDSKLSLEIIQEPHEVLWLHVLHLLDEEDYHRDVDDAPNDDH